MNIAVEKVIRTDRPILALDFRADGRLLAMAGGIASSEASGYIAIVETDSWKMVSQLPGHAPLTRALAFLPDGVRLASGGRDGVARIWRIDSASPLAEMRHGFPVLGVAVDGAGSVVATAAGDPTTPGQMGLWTVPDGGFVRAFEGHGAGIYSVAFEPGPAARRVASSCIDAHVRTFDVATGAPELDLVGHQAPCWSVAWSPDGATLASASHDGTARLWDASTGALRHELTGFDEFVAQVRFWPSSELLIAASQDAQVRVFSVDDGALLGALPIGAPCWALAIDPLGRRFAVGTLTGEVRVFRNEDAG